MLNSQIIAILAAILFPVFARAREKARSTSCQSNVKQLCLGLMMYCQDYDEMMCPSHISWSLEPTCTMTGWSRLVMPYVNNQQILVCPSDSSPGGLTYSNYHQYNKSYAVSYQAHATSVTLAQIQSPAEVVSTACSGTDYPGIHDDDAWAAGIWPENSNNNSRVAGRHNQQSTIGFVDGHVKTMAAPATTSPVNMWVVH